MLGGICKSGQSLGEISEVSPKKEERFEKNLLTAFFFFFLDNYFLLL
jgi:hypothetical protein